MPIQDSAQTSNVISVTADVTLTRGQFPCLVHNLDAVDDHEVTLPQDAKGGEMIKVVVLSANALNISPGPAGAIYGTETTTFAKQADDKHLSSSTVGDAMELHSLGGGDWVAINQLNGVGAIGYDLVET